MVLAKQGAEADTATSTRNASDKARPTTENYDMVFVVLVLV